MDNKSNKTLIKQFNRRYAKLQDTMSALGMKVGGLHNVVPYVSKATGKRFSAFPKDAQEFESMSKLLKKARRIAKADFEKREVERLKAAQQKKKVLVYADLKLVLRKTKEVKKDEGVFFTSLKFPKDGNRIDAAMEWFEATYPDFPYINEDSEEIIEVVSVKVKTSRRPINASVQPAQVPMKRAEVLKYDWLRYADGIGADSFKNMDGRCVYSLLVEHLKKTWVSVDEQKLFEMFKTFGNGIDEYFDEPPFNGKFTVDSGVNSEMIHHLCVKKNISMYAYDRTNNCFMKHVATNGSNYKPIIFYMVDEHMYLIDDSKVIKTISASERSDNPEILLSSLLNDEGSGHEEVPEGVETVEAASFNEALKKSNAIVYLDQNDMTEEVVDYIVAKKSVPKVKSKGHNIIAVELPDQQLTILCDPNRPDGASWKQAKRLCEVAGIKFANQTIGRLISELKNRFFGINREYLSAEQKASVIKAQNDKCNACSRKVERYELDHIKNLASGGTNDISNFQALCEPCHKAKTKAEAENTDFVKWDKTSSSFNPDAMKVIQSGLFKCWAFVEKVATPTKGEVQKIDMNKTRRNILLHSKYDYPIYSVMDYPVRYNGRDPIVCGVYYVETEQYFPFKGIGWYPYPLVQYGLETGLIRNSDIKYKFLPTEVLKADHFNAFVEMLSTLASQVDEKLTKLVVNALIGCWAITTKTFSKHNFTLDRYEASNHFIKENVYVATHDVGQDMTLFSIMESNDVINDDFHLPFYNQIVALEAVELHRLEALVTEHGGVVLDRNTDAIRYEHGKKYTPIDISGHYWDDQKRFPKYKWEEAEPLKVDAMAKICRTDKFVLKKATYNLIPEQDDFDAIAEQVIASGKGVLINGQAGTGKTYLTNMIITKLEADGKRLIKTAPTVKAASLMIGGQTIHSFYLSINLSANYQRKILKKLRDVDYIVVDEISMVKEIFYRFFLVVKKYAPNIKFIIAGDFRQLEPVNDRYKGRCDDYMNSRALFNLVDGNKIVLNTCRRSDKELFDLYQDVGAVNVEDFRATGPTERNLAFTHDKRKQVNKACMHAYIKNKEFIKVKPSPSNPKTQTTYIAEGMPAVGFMNHQDTGIVNNEMYTVTKIAGRNITLTATAREFQVTIPASHFSKYLYPGFCITVHTSQGETYDHPYTIHEWSRYSRAMKYVSLSRATKLKHVCIAK